MNAKETRDRIIEWVVVIAGGVTLISPIWLAWLAHMELRNTWHFALYGFAILIGTAFWHSFLQYDDLAEKQRPKIRTSCGRDIVGSRPLNEWGSGLVCFLRIAVESESQIPLKNCRATLIEIGKDDKIRWGGDSAVLTFAPGEDSDSQCKTIYPKKPEYVDVLAVHHTGEIRPGTKDRKWLFLPRLDQIFDERGDYTLTVHIAGDSIPPELVRLKFEWRGHIGDSSLEQVIAPSSTGPTATTKHSPTS